MGAIANMAPEKFSGIIAQVPFVDVLATMLDNTLPSTPPEWPEWGNPLTDKAAYDQIASYSHYENSHGTELPTYLCAFWINRPACYVLGTGKIGC
jgi:oligopeptidase B